MVQGFYERRHLRRDGQEFLGYNTIGPGNLATAHPDLLGVLYPTLIGSALFQQERERAGGDITMQWRPNSAFDVTVSSFYSAPRRRQHQQQLHGLGDQRDRQQRSDSGYTVRNNTLVNAVFPKSSPTHLDPTTGQLLLCFNNNPRGDNGRLPCPVDGVVEDSIYRPGAAASTWYIDGDAHWMPTSNWDVHAKLGYTRGEGLTPSQPTWESATARRAWATALAPPGRRRRNR